MEHQVDFLHIVRQPLKHMMLFSVMTKILAANQSA